MGWEKIISVNHRLLSRDWQIREFWGFATEGSPPGAFRDLLNLVKLLLLLGLLLSACTPLPRPAQQPLSVYLKEASQHIAGQQYGEALKLLEEASQLYPKAPLPVIKMGQIYLRQGRWLPAEDAFNRALARDLENPLAMAGLAESMLNQGHLGEATTLWRRSAELDPQLPGVFTGLGRSYLWRLNFEAAEAAFRQQQASRPDPEAQWSLAALTAPLDLAAAREMLLTLPAQASPDLLNRRDYLLTTLAPFTTTSSQAEIAQATGIALAQVQLWPLAVQALTIAREQAGSQTAEEQAETLAFLAYALTYTGRPTLELFEEARTLDPASALPLYFYGIYLRRQGALKAAEETLQQALQLDPENAAVYMELAQTEAQRGNLTIAEDYLSKAAIAARDDLNIQLLRVKFYALRGYRLEEAGIPAAEALITVDKDNAELHDLLGWMQFLTGDSNQAERSLRRALELDPNLAGARYHLARYLANQGDTTAAATEYQRVIDLDTSNIYRDQALEELQQLTPVPQE